MDKGPGKTIFFSAPPLPAKSHNTCNILGPQQFAPPYILPLTPYCRHCSETPLSQCHFDPHESHADFVRLLPDYLTMMSLLIIVQRDATQSSLFVILQVHSTCFGCQPHPSPGVHKTVTTISGTGHILVHLPPSNVVKLGHVASGAGHIFVHLPPSNVAKLGHWPRWREVAAHKKYDQYPSLQLQFCVLLMMGVVDTRNM